jgi:hypothetical protein
MLLAVVKNDKIGFPFDEGIDDANQQRRATSFEIALLIF